MLHSNQQTVSYQVKTNWWSLGVRVDDKTKINIKNIIWIHVDDKDSKKEK